MGSKRGVDNRYKVIPRTLVFIINGNRVLLINQSNRDKFGYDKWNGVGGHIERGENPLEAAIREVYEETGLKIKDLKLKYISLVDENENTGVCLFIFLGYSRKTKTLQSNEGVINWFPICDLSNLDLVKDVPKLLELIIKSINCSSVKILNYSLSKKGYLRIDVIG